MKYIKQHKLLCILALSTNTLMAGGLGSVCMGEDVTLLCNLNGWEFSIDALNLKPSYGGGFGSTQYINSDNHTSYFPLNAKSSWGFKVGGAYHFGDGNDLSLNWFHHEKSESSSQTIGSAQNPIAITRDTRPKWDAVNFEFGQIVRFGENKSIRYHGGLEYARIGNRIDGQQSGEINGDTMAVSLNATGPRTGMDLNYHWNKYLNFYAKGAGSLLVGKSEFSTRTYGTFDVPGSTSGSRDILVPELEGTLGLSLTYETPQGDYFIDASYLWVNYFNALEIVTISPSVGKNGVSNYGVQGPFLGFKFIGYV